MCENVRACLSAPDCGCEISSYGFLSDLSCFRCSDLLRAVKMQQGTKSDAHGTLLQSFRNMDITTGPAGTPRPTANTGDQQRWWCLAYPIIESSQSHSGMHT